MHAHKFSVLVTRPETLAKPLMTALENMGGLVYHFPTLNIKFLSDDKIVQDTILHLPDYTWHIFASRHAVQAIMPQVVKTWSMLDLSPLHWATVGPGTAQELAHFIKADIIYPKTSLGAKALLTVLEDKIKTGDTVLEWCGDKPTGVWPGAKQVMCYQREKNVTSALQVNHFDYVIITSGTSMECLDLQTIEHSVLIVISERLVMLAKTLGFKGKIILAKGADEASIINAIKGDLT
jgi:uroporphyrinogen-III synthase